MAFGIQEPADGFQPTSTDRIQTIDNNAEERVLVPQPSDSPRDPLNWSRIKKELCFLTILLGSFATGSLGPLFVPGFAVLVTHFDVPLTSITLLNGSLVMALGVSAYLCACFAAVFGKRIVYLVTTTILVVTCCWAAASKSYTSLLVSRVFQGLGMGGFFALAGTASLNDLYFVHERGFRVGLWNFGVIASVNLTPVISGYVISNLSWRWSLWLEALFFGVVLAAVVCFFPETSFNREHREGTPVASVEPKSDQSSEFVVETPSSSRGSWKAFVSDFIGWDPERLPNRPILLTACVKPWAIILHPVVIWECVMWAVVFTWTILIGSVASQIFTAPPFNMSTVAVGNLTGIAPFIGSALGTALGGWICDLSGKAMSRHNGGIYEPEFRLVAMPVAIVAMAAGTFGLGVAVERGVSAIACGVLLAIVNFAVGMGCTTIVVYTNDVCAERAGDAFGLSMIIKSAFAFGLSFVFNTYLATSGPVVFFSTFGAVTVGVMLTTVPMYVFGKKIRAWSEKHNLLRRA
ncbi:hypothetical protein DPV78_005518 [Talaromyces pinophilus]|nr:hypothetical protein DPV78_005518 [Talaromyces pinophilus]